MDGAQRGWQLGGYVGSRLAVVYALLAAVCFALQVAGAQGMAAIWRPDRVALAGWLGNDMVALLLAPVLILIPIGLAWLAGSVAGLLTGLMAWLFTNRAVARWWGMFCFSLPPLLFHAAADLRPTLALGEHWLNAYWFWIGLPTIIAVLVGGWVGEQLAGQGAWVKGAR